MRLSGTILVVLTKDLRSVGPLEIDSIGWGQSIYELRWKGQKAERALLLAPPDQASDNYRVTTAEEKPDLEHATNSPLYLWGQDASAAFGLDGLGFHWPCLGSEP